MIEFAINLLIVLVGIEAVIMVAQWSMLAIEIVEEIKKERR